MNYEKLITTISEIINNENIVKDGLSLTYHLTEKNHRQMNEDLYYRINGIHKTEFKSVDVFEVDIDGILVKFIKKSD